jgi:hypothetical protein
MSAILRAYAAATVAVALLDASDGVVFFGLTLKFNPIVVLQYIASGVFGAASYGGGLATAAAGFGLHVLISAVVVGLFIAAYLAVPAIRTYRIPAALLYGAGVWLVMNLVVLPNSAATPVALTVLSVVHGLIGHALFVGLPIALVAGRVLGNRVRPQATR